MARVVWSPQAEADLEDIWLYIAQDGPERADRVVRAVAKRSSLLGDQPGIGTPRDELLPGLFGFPVESYVIFYRKREHGIEIVRVLHAARDIEKILYGEGDSGT